MSGWSENAILAFTEEQILRGVTRNSLMAYLPTLRLAREILGLEKLSKCFSLVFDRIKVWAALRNARNIKNLILPDSETFRFAMAIAARKMEDFSQ